MIHLYVNMWYKYLYISANKYLYIYIYMWIKKCFCKEMYLYNYKEQKWQKNRIKYILYMISNISKKTTYVTKQVVYINKNVYIYIDKWKYMYIYTYT